MNKVIEKDGKYYNKCQIHLIELDIKSNLFINRHFNVGFNKQSTVLEYNENQPEHFVTRLGLKYVHIYITSDEEIKEYDWIYYPMPQANYPGKINHIIEQYQTNKHDKELVQKFCKKIIATTDKCLLVTVHGKGSIVTPEYLPQPSKQFIQKYITEYNKGNIITECLVEYSEYTDGTRDEDGYPLSKYKLHIDSHNCITIKPIKDTYTREEVIKLLLEAPSGLKIHEYIEQNL